MIAVAALLVLTGLGLFVGGLLTGMAALYWACVAGCAVAAVLLALARRRLGDIPERTAVTTTGGPAAAPATTRRAAPPAGSGPAAPGVTGGSVAEPVPVREAEGADPGVPPIEEVEVTDLLLVVDLTDEVLVIDERPRYHLAGCRHLAGATGIPLPLDEARADGFTPCGVCAPDRNLAERARRRNASGS